MEKIKSYVRKIPLLYCVLRKAYRFFLPEPELGITEQIERALREKTPVFFVQVGSNDGLQRDPIHRLIVTNKKWSGIFIEPVGFVFQRLKQNYNNAGRFTFENVAIGTKKGITKFYYVSEEARSALGDDLPSWYDQLGSFDRNHILKFLDGRLEPYIVEEELECVTMEEIFERNSVERVDLLHIDAEGFDFKILSQIDFKRYKPLIVLYEHAHLPVTEKEKAKSFLTTSGYSLREYDTDTLAIFKG